MEILTFDGGQLLDVAGPLQVFASCNDLLAEQNRPAAYSLGVLARGGGMVTMSSGLALSATDLDAGLTRVDTLIVAGGRGVDQAALDPQLLAWLRQRAACARARSLGLHRGIPARSGRAPRWPARGNPLGALCPAGGPHPRVRVEADPIFIADGHYWTSAGVTAGIDLALAMVEQDLGRALALAVARRLVVFLKRPGGQAQFSATLELQRSERFRRCTTGSAPISPAISVAALAAQAAMSERSLLRHYTAAVGMTPARAVERLRVEAARLRLSDSGTADQGGRQGMRLRLGGDHAA